MKAGSPTPVSISMTCVVAGLAIAVFGSVRVLGSVVHTSREIDVVFVQLRETLGKDSGGNEVTHDGASSVEALVLAYENVLQRVTRTFLIEAQDLGDVRDLPTAVLQARNLADDVDGRGEL